jgi:hypothetical protein
VNARALIKIGDDSPLIGMPERDEIALPLCLKTAGLEV